MSWLTFVRHAGTAAAFVACAMPCAVACAAASATVAAAAGSAAAVQPLDAALPALHAAAVHAGTAATTAKPLLFGARRAGDKALAQQRGGTDLASDTSLRGVVSDNQAIGNATGSNLITGGALAGASGVPVVVQNTGNNVLIQSATIVNVQLK